MIDEKALSFFGKNILILSFFTTLVVFLNQYMMLGSILIEGISGIKLFTILPVVVVLAFNFFAFTFLVIAGCFLSLFGALFYGIAAFFHFILKTDKTTFMDAVKMIFNSSSALLLEVITILFLIFVKKGVFTFSQFMLIYYIVSVISLGYFYRLLSQAAIQLYSAPKTKVLTITLIPILILLIVGVLFGLKVLPKLAPLIA